MNRFKQPRKQGPLHPCPYLLVKEPISVNCASHLKQPPGNGSKAIVGWPLCPILDQPLLMSDGGGDQNIGKSPVVSKSRHVFPFSHTHWPGCHLWQYSCAMERDTGVVEACSQPSSFPNRLKAVSPLQPNFLSSPEADKSIYLIRKEEGERLGNSPGCGMSDNRREERGTKIICDS